MQRFWLSRLPTLSTPAALCQLPCSLRGYAQRDPLPLLHAPTTNLSCFLFFTCSLRGYAQRDPLVEYKLEGYNLFVEMMAQVRRLVQQRSLELNTETTATAICMRMLLLLLLRV